MAATASVRSSRMRTISPLSMATSVPTPDGDPDIGLRERRCIVDPVAHKCHHLALRLEIPDFPGLVLWQHSCVDILDPDLSRDGVRRPLVVARDHRQPASPILFRSAIAAFVVGFRVSATARMPASPPDAATRTAVFPLILEGGYPILGLFWNCGAVAPR